MYLTGLLSIALMSLSMSLSMLLSARPLWLEKPLDGLDRIYRLHKWSGILVIGFGASLWLLELTSDIIRPLIGSAGRLPKVKYEGLLEVLRKLGDDMGEWALYAALAMLVITLSRRLPYHLWRHRQHRFAGRDDRASPTGQGLGCGGQQRGRRDSNHLPARRAVASASSRKVCLHRL